MLLSEHSHERYNPLTGEWVLVSPHRTKRPWLGQSENSSIGELPSYESDCYLCPGNYRIRGTQNPEYASTYVFQNDFAALQATKELASSSNGLFQAKAVHGICKVICFSPNHSLTMAEMDQNDIIRVINTWQHEFEQLSSLPSISNVQFFENKGEIMGCSNPHPHGQIWAQNSIPNEISIRTLHQEKYFQQHGQSLLSTYLEEELASRERVILENAHFVCLVPYWAVWPYETMVIPRRHFQSIADMTSMEKEAFAEIIQRTMIKYDNLFSCSFPYSAGMIQRPTDAQPYEGWHFHYAFYPPLLRSATVKKFMVGYEMFASPQRDITAEQAADKLRSLEDKHYKSLSITVSK